MMTTKVITTFNQQLYNDYAHKFWNTFPHGELDLSIYSEDALPIPHKTLTYHKAFVERNAHKKTTNFKLDAVRFCYKPYAIAQCLEEECGSGDYERILWIDADTIFLKAIDEKWIDHRLDAIDTIMTYMGRLNYHSETGLLLFNLRHGHTKRFIHTVREYYDTQRIYLLDEYHDSYVWDYVRRQFEHQGYKFNDVGDSLNKHKGGHIQAYRFGEWMDHTKGKRKLQGYSSENIHSNNK